MDENERARPSLRPLTESEKHASSTGWVALVPLLFVPVVVLSIANVAIDPPALRYAVMGLCIAVQLALVILIAARIGGRGARLRPRDLTERADGDDEGSRTDER